MPGEVVPPIPARWSLLDALTTCECGRPTRRAFYGVACCSLCRGPDPVGEVVPPIPLRDEATMTAALKRFGWTCGPAFWQRYYSDAWVFNLANAVEVLTERIAELEQNGE